MAKNGNNSAAQPDYSAWARSVNEDAMNYAAALLRDRNDAEDVVHDCYCRLLARADVYDLPRDGRKVLFQAITNACINRVTRSRKAVSLDGDNSDGGCLRELVADRQTPSAERELMLRELQEAVGSAMATLPPQQRSALNMRTEGHSMREIASAVDVTVGHAGLLVHRARKALAKRLAPYLEAI